MAAPDWGWWRERRPPAELLHLDSASAGRSSVETLRAAAAHALREAQLGGYVAQAEAEPVLAAGRADLGELLGVPANGVAFVESAGVALRTLLDVWPLTFGDRVAVLPSEWGPARHQFEHRGYELVPLPAEPSGLLDLAGFELLLAGQARPALVHLTQVASHRPLVQPVAAAAVLCRAAGVPLWVDAAQATGHVDTASGADAVYATSRKWLTGPRGVGVIGIAAAWWDLLRISAPELQLLSMSADAGPVRLLESAEAHVAGRVGLCNAVREFLDAGPAAGWQRLAEVGQLTRELLSDLPGWEVVEPAGDVAITALRPLAGQDVSAERRRLLDEHGIVTSAALTARAPLDMASPLLRISPHVDCTPAIIERLRKSL
jgi:pyridoxal 5-phosphate dependent beta-lyase